LVQEIAVMPDAAKPRSGIGSSHGTRQLTGYSPRPEAHPSGRLRRSLRHPASAVRAARAAPD